MGNPDAGGDAVQEPHITVSPAGHEEIGHIDDLRVRLHMRVGLPMLGQRLAMVRCVQHDIVLICRFGHKQPEEFIHLKADPVVIGIDELLTSGRAGVDGLRCFHDRLPDRGGRIVRISVAIVKMEALLVDENEIAAFFIQKGAENAGYAQILRGFKINVALLESLIVHPLVQGSHVTIPGRFHERIKAGFIDVDAYRLVPHFLCVIEEGRVLVGSKGVVGKCVVTADQIGIADVGKGTCGDTNA